MLRRFVPQKPVPSVDERPLHSDTDGNNRFASREEPRTSTIIDYQKPMAEQGGKDILSSDVEIKEGATFIGKSEVTSGTIPAKSAPVRPEIVRQEPVKAAFGGRG